MTYDATRGVDPLDLLLLARLRGGCGRYGQEPSSHVNIVDPAIHEDPTGRSGVSDEESCRVVCVLSHGFEDVWYALG